MVFQGEKTEWRQGKKKSGQILPSLCEFLWLMHSPWGCPSPRGTGALPLALTQSPPSDEDAQETSAASLSHAGPAQCGGYFAPESQPQPDLLKPSAGENKGSGRSRSFPRQGLQVKGSNGSTGVITAGSNLGLPPPACVSFPFLLRGARMTWPAGPTSPGCCQGQTGRLNALCER